jgi:hypothetical protein
MFGHILRSNDERYQKALEHIIKDTGVLKGIWNTTDEKDVLQLLTTVAETVFSNSGIGKSLVLGGEGGEGGRP